jgi:hypothetical protein
MVVGSELIVMMEGGFEMVGEWVEIHKTWMSCWSEEDVRHAMLSTFLLGA